MRCVSCALEQMEVLGKFNRKRMEAGQPALSVGMGIHTGPLVAGYIGSSKALSYTVIGDTANTSARLCGVAVGGQIVVSEDTLSTLGSAFEYEELPPAALKGKTKPFKIYNILGTRTAVAGSARRQVAGKRRAPAHQRPASHGRSASSTACENRTVPDSCPGEGPAAA